MGLPTARDRFRTLSVEATSQDGGMRLTLTAQPTVELTVFPGAFRRYRSTREAEEQLADLLSIAFETWDETRRDLQRQIRENRGRKVVAGGRGDRFEAEALRLTGSAASPRGWVRVATRGLVAWRVRLADNALDQLDPRAFAAEVGSAVTSAIEEFNQRKRRLRTRVVSEGT